MKMMMKWVHEDSDEGDEDDANDDLDDKADGDDQCDEDQLLRWVESEDVSKVLSLQDDIDQDVVPPPHPD